MAGKKLVLCDSNILIHLLRGREEVKHRLFDIGFENIRLSIISSAEIYYGARDKLEFARLHNIIEKFTVYPINEEVSMVFHGLVINYSLSHKIGIPDSLIAATAITFSVPLYTENTKDFNFIPGLKIYYPRS